MASPESSQEPVAALVPQLQLVLTIPTSPLLCLCRYSVFLSSCVLASTGARLILIRPTLCAQVAFLTAVPTNNVLAWIRIVDLMLAFFLPFLPPLPKLSTSIGSEVLFATKVLNAS